MANTEHGNPPMTRMLVIVMLALLLASGAAPWAAAQSDEPREADERAEDILAEAEAEAPPPFEGVEPAEESEHEDAEDGPGDDRFIPTERLRYDQEVDYPTDI